ncbi:urea transporter [Mycena leptocephala]|nr:urea transporter [Mycena leptocephala]
MSSVSTVLPQGAGYGVGEFQPFTRRHRPLLQRLHDRVDRVQARYTPFSPRSSEEFSSASRSVKPGLIAAGIVSAWTWAATCCKAARGIQELAAMVVWAGATIQVLLFAMVKVSASETEAKRPYAHTWLEVVGARWGKPAHLIFMFFGLATNIIVSSMLVLGGSATVTDLTGMSTIAACFLIPLGVSIYVVVGGCARRCCATSTSGNPPSPPHNYLPELWHSTHTTVLFAIILVFVFTVYATSPKIGSPARMYELLTAAAEAAPVPGNAHGSYITMRSKNGLIFGVINIIGNFATVFQDQAYFQRAIASRPSSTVKAYLLGGLAWFAIPSHSHHPRLAAVALRGDPAMRVLSAADVSAGLPAAAAASALLGKSGAAALLILLFLAVTSATSAELIAVSSLLTYDVYKKYINPEATEAQILRMSHLMVAFYALVIGLAGLIFFYIGVSMGWLYTFMGVILGSGVAPIALCITWSRANKTGCIVGALAGFAAGIIAWLVTTSTLNGGVINVVTSGGDFEMLAGNLASIGVGAIIATASSYMWPENYDFESRARSTSPRRPRKSRGERNQRKEERPSVEKKEKEKTPSVADSFDAEEIEDELDPVALNKAFRFAAWSSLALVTGRPNHPHPAPAILASTIYGKGGLTAWVVVGIIWTFLSAFSVVLYPLWESRAPSR